MTLPVVALAAAWSQAPAAEPRCGESCLQRLMHAYLDRLERHDPTGLPLSPAINARQNAKPMRLGEGAWKNMGKIRPGQMFTDAKRGAALYYGAVDMGGRYASLVLRLKIADGLITESEMFFETGSADAGFSKAENLLEPDILYTAPVPKERRSSEQELIRITDGYMEAISRHDGSIAATGARCDRWAGGYKVTNNFERPPERGGGTCAQSMNNLKGQTVVNRRFFLVDEDLGLVGVAFLIPHAERTPSNTTNVIELFKIVDGKIRSIEEFSFGGAFPPSSGFPD